MLEMKKKFKIDELMMAKLLLDHGRNESVESGNESLKLRIHFTFFTTLNLFFCSCLCPFGTSKTLDEERNYARFSFVSIDLASLQMCCKIIKRNKK
jgi:hypothetical protein